MQIKINSKVLLKHINTVIGAIAKQKYAPIGLKCLVFEVNEGEVSVTATDYEVSMTTFFSAETENSGKFAVEAKILADTLTKLPEQGITIQKDPENKHLEVFFGVNGKIKIQTEDPEEIHVAKNVSGDDMVAFVMPAEILSKGIEKTVDFVAPQNSLKPQFEGVLLHFSSEGVSFVATDSNVMAWQYFKNVFIYEERKIILPTKSAILLEKMLKNSGATLIKFNQEVAEFLAGTTLLKCKLIEEKYPDYTTIIPQECTGTMTANTAEFVKLLEFASMYADETKKVVLNLQENEICAIEAGSAVQISESIDCYYSGIDTKIAFNSGYFLSAVKNIKSRQMSLYLSKDKNNDHGACVVKPTNNEDNGEMTMIIMPLKSI